MPITHRETFDHRPRLPTVRRAEGLFYRLGRGRVEPPFSARLGSRFRCRCLACHGLVQVYQSGRVQRRWRGRCASWNEQKQTNPRCGGNAHGTLRIGESLHICNRREKNSFGKSREAYLRPRVSSEPSVVFHSELASSFGILNRRCSPTARPDLRKASAHPAECSRFILTPRSAGQEWLARFSP